MMTAIPKHQSRGLGAARAMASGAADRIGSIRMRGVMSRVGAALLLVAAWSSTLVGSVAAQEPSSDATQPAAGAPPATPPPAPPAAVEQQSSPDPNKWQFEVTPYFWAGGMDGTAGVGNVTAGVDMGVGDILDRLDGAFMGMVEARKGDWALLFDGGFMRLEGEHTTEWQGPGGIGTATGDLAVSATEKIYNAALGRRVVNEADGSKADLIFGARYTSVESQLNLVVSGGGTLPGGTRSVSDEEGWLDPIIGLRLLFPFADRWTLVGYADIGGFGVASDITTQALVGVNWEMTKRFVAKLGYRYLMDDYRNDAFVWEMATHGVYAGVGIRF